MKFTSDLDRPPHLWCKIGRSINCNGKSPPNIQTYYYHEKNPFAKIVLIKYYEYRSIVRMATGCRCNNSFRGIKRNNCPKGAKVTGIGKKKMKIYINLKCMKLSKSVNLSDLAFVLPLLHSYGRYRSISPVQHRV